MLVFANAVAFAINTFIGIANKGIKFCLNFRAPELKVILGRPVNCIVDRYVVRSVIIRTNGDGLLILLGTYGSRDNNCLRS